MKDCGWKLESFEMEVLGRRRSLILLAGSAFILKVPSICKSFGFLLILRLWGTDLMLGRFTKDDHCCPRRIPPRRPPSTFRAAADMQDKDHVEIRNGEDDAGLSDTALAMFLSFYRA